MRGGERKSKVTLELTGKEALRVSVGSSKCTSEGPP